MAKNTYTYTLNVFSSGDPAPVSNAENFGKPVNIYGMDLTAGDTELKKASTQVYEPTINTTANLDLVEPPYDLNFLISLNGISVTRSSCIDACATNTVGLGYRIKRVDPNADETDRDDISDSIKMQLEKWAARGGLTFAELLKQVKIDEETMGNGCIEVSRNRKGEIDGLYHMPAQTMKIKKDRSGFVQVRGNGLNNVPFYNFGDKVELREDGTARILPDRSPLINELIHFKLPNTKSSYYGIPRDIGAIQTMIGDDLARSYNNKFFLYSATPEIALIFEVDAGALPSTFGDQPVKVEIDPNTKRDIEEHFRRNLSSKTFEPALFHLPPGVKMRVEKLSTEMKDSSWTTYRDNNKKEIREAHRCPEIILGGSDSNFANTAVAKSVYLEQVISPEQERYESRLMALLWPELLMISAKDVPAEVSEDGDLTIKPKVRVSPANGTGIDPNIWRLDFKEMSVADKAVDAQVNNIYGTLGVLTINEIRMSLGMKPLKHGDSAPKPPGGAEGNAAAQNAQLTQAQAGNPEIPFVTNMAPGTVTPTKKVDITGLPRRSGPIGTSSPQLPRRPFEPSVPTPANIDRTMRPLQKSDVGTPDIDQEQALDNLFPSNEDHT